MYPSSCYCLLQSHSFVNDHIWLVFYSVWIFPLKPFLYLLLAYHICSILFSFCLAEALYIKCALRMQYNGPILFIKCSVSVFATFTTQLELILLSFTLSIDGFKPYKHLSSSSFSSLSGVVNIRWICKESSHFVICYFTYSHVFNITRKVL